MAAPTVDTSRFPLVIVTFVGLSSEAEFDGYLAAMEECVLGRKQQNVTILDARQAGRAPPTQRKKQAEWLKKHQELLRQLSLGTVFVIDSPLIRGALTAILWLQPMPTQHRVVGTFAEAERWAIAQLAQAGVTVPPDAPAAARR